MPEAKPASKSLSVLIVLLLVSFVGIAAVIYVTSRPSAPEETAPVSVTDVPKTVPTPTPPPAPMEEEGMDVIDTTITSDAEAIEGQRYKVLVIDDAREGASGVARIGGRVTFVKNARRGDLAIIEVTRIKLKTAEAVVIEKLASDQPVPEQASRPPRPPSRDAQPSGLVGTIHQGTITSVGREGDGVTHVDGKVVFVAGAAEGQQVEFKITEDAGRFARAELISTSGGPAGSGDDVRPASQSAAKTGEDVVTPVQAGEEYDVEITEDDRRNPGINGVARIKNFVVFVPDTKIGDRVRVRITTVRARAANAEVLERMGP